MSPLQTLPPDPARELCETILFRYAKAFDLPVDPKAKARVLAEAVANTRALLDRILTDYYEI